MDATSKGFAAGSPSCNPRQSLRLHPIALNYYRYLKFFLDNRRIVLYNLIRYFGKLL